MVAVALQLRVMQKWEQYQSPIHIRGTGSGRKLMVVGLVAANHRHEHTYIQHVQKTNNDNEFNKRI